MRTPRLALTWTIVALFVSALVIALSFSRITERADRLALDSLSAWRAPASDPSVIIVAIDQPSLTALGRWPWPRSVHARMVDRLNEAGAKTIVYDVLFVEPGEGDDALAAVMAKRRSTFLPMLIERPGRNGAAEDRIMPIASLAADAAGVGSAPVLFDDDGVVRRVALSMVGDDRQPLPHLMELAYRHGHGGQPSPLYKSFGAKSGPDDTLMLPLAPTGSYRTASFSSVLAGEVPDSFFAGKTVLVGAVAPGMGDVYPVAWSAGSLMPGIEIQANMLAALGGRHMIRDIPLPLVALASVLPVILLLTGFWYLRPRAAIGLAVAALLIWLALVSLILVLGGYWLPPVPALAGLLIAYPIWGWRRLETISNWVGSELRDMRTELSAAPRFRSAHPTDRVGAKVEALADAITALKDERRFSQKVLEASPDALLVEDREGRVGFANEAADRLFGQPVEGHVASDLTKGGDFVSGDRPVGEHIVSVGIASLEDGAGQPNGRIVRLADVTAIRQAEAEREAVLQFLSHDMRAPQSSIISLLESAEGKALPEAIRDRIARNAHHTLDLADGFVRLARAQSAAIEEAVFDMADVMAEAADTVWPDAQAADVAVDVNASDPCLALGDPAMLMRALINLICNAVEHSPAGESVKVALVKGGAGPGWTVADRGPGLEIADQGVTPFATGKKEGRSREGIGLGLAFVETVATRHGGILRAVKREGGGTIATLTLAADRLQPD